MFADDDRKSSQKMFADDDRKKFAKITQKLFDSIC